MSLFNETTAGNLSIPKKEHLKKGKWRGIEKVQSGGDVFSTCSSLHSVNISQETFQLRKISLSKFCQVEVTIFAVYKR
jgi:hypothetical protein